jgi:arabinofuranosyltransferase
VAGFLSVWVLLSDEMNFFVRFQYPLLPIVAMSWPRLAIDLRFGRAPRVGTGWVAAGCAALAILFFYQHTRYQTGVSRDGRYDVARALAPFADAGETMVVTEAGLLPLYSRWRAIDAWGLNDRRIAREGGLTVEYLDEIEPAVIMFHGYFPPAAETAPLGAAWNDMVATLDGYARERGYVLAAVYGPTAEDTHAYYVRPDFNDRDRVTAAIRSVSYAWGGRRVADLARDERPR